MNAFLRKSTGLAFVFITGATESFSQIDWSKYEVGFTGGVFIYQGDLTPSQAGSYRTPSVNFNLFANRIISSKLSIRANIAMGRLRGSDAAYTNPVWRPQRNFNFSSPVVEVSGLAVYKIRQERKIGTYVFGGIGITKLNVQRDWSGFNSEYFAGEPELPENLSADVAHKLPRLLPVVPVGIGVEYVLTDRTLIIGETAYRFTATDYLDGFSKSGNASKLDHYQSHSIGIKYRFGKRSGVDCPDIRF